MENYYDKRSFDRVGWPTEATKQLDTWVEILRLELSAEALTEIYPFYNWMIVNQPAFALLSDSLVDDADGARIGKYHA